MKTLTKVELINKGYESTMKIVNKIEDEHEKKMCSIVADHYRDIMVIELQGEKDKLNIGSPVKIVNEIETEEKEAFDWTEDQRKDFNNDLKFAEHRENS